ncbi:hypothetical protein ACQ4PT_046325 [Festuca glaucescens]
MGAAPADEKPHVVCLPFPAQGHVTPMMKLAKILHCNGFYVTFVNTEYNHRRLVRSRGPTAAAGLSDFRFATIPDGLPPSDADATQDPESLCYYTMTTCLPHMTKLLEDLNSTAGVPPVTCVLGDNVMSFCVAVRALLDRQRLWLHGLPQFPIPHGRGPLSSQKYTNEEQLRNEYLDTPVTQAPGMSSQMRLRDFPSFICTTDRTGILLNFLMHEVEQSDRAAAIILNTLDELEQPALDAMRDILPPVYTIGPLNFLAEQLLPDGGGPLATTRSSLWREDRSCLEWLHGREPRSVVYVNYGSVTTMSRQELVEFAWGLANCGYDFLWIVRNDLLAKGDAAAAAALPAEFLEATKGRCLLTSWCEQEAVLRHEAVGVFLTHCGWNSTMEGLSAGVPMLCWPFFADQQTNTRYACVEWGVGMEVGDDVRREVVEATIREAMGGELGKEMKRKAMEWKEVGLRATTQPGGRSLANFDSLLKDVLTASKKSAG